MRIQFRVGLLLATVLAQETVAQPVLRRWTIDASPVVTIGDGGSSELFVGVVGVVVEKSGVIAIADNPNRVVHYYSPDGRRLGSIGRNGAGPGEFRTIKSMRPCVSDSAAVYDPALARVTFLAPGGRMGRVLSLHDFAPRGLPPTDVWCNAAGSLAVLTRDGAPPSGLGPGKQLGELTIVAPQGQPISLGTFPVGEVYFTGREQFPRPLGRRTSIAVSTSSVFVGTAESSDVLEFGLDGKKKRVIHWDREGIRVRPSHIQAYIDDVLHRGLLGPNVNESFLRSLTYPDLLPAHGELLVDDLGNLWVENFAVPGQKEREWLVFEDGSPLAVVSVPQFLRILLIRGDKLFGVWRDENEAETVRVYRIRKGG